MKIKDSIRALSNSNGDIITDGFQNANTLNKYFASVFCKEDDENVPIFQSLTSVKCKDPIFDVNTIQGKLKI